MVGPVAGGGPLALAMATGLLHTYRTTTAVMYIASSLH